MLEMIAGQWLFVACCVVYVVWWNVSFRPQTEVNRVGGFRGILLGITAFLGIGGVGMSMHGAIQLALPVGAAPLTLPVPAAGIVVAGVVAFGLSLLVTWGFLKRQPTTELTLIVAWCVLEAIVIDVACACGTLGGTPATVAVCTIAASTVSSLVLYVLYYRLPEWPAFYTASIPLVTSGLVTALIACLIRV